MSICTINIPINMSNHKNMENIENIIRSLTKTRNSSEKERINDLLAQLSKLVRSKHDVCKASVVALRSLKVKCIDDKVIVKKIKNWLLPLPLLR